MNLYLINEHLAVGNSTEILVFHEMTEKISLKTTYKIIFLNVEIDIIIHYSINFHHKTKSSLNT